MLWKKTTNENKIPKTESFITFETIKVVKSRSTLFRFKSLRSSKFHASSRASTVRVLNYFDCRPWNETNWYWRRGDNTSSRQMNEMITMAKPRKSLLRTETSVSVVRTHAISYSLRNIHPSIHPHYPTAGMCLFYYIMYYKFVHSTSMENLLFVRYSCVYILCSLCMESIE